MTRRPHRPSASRSSHETSRQAVSQTHPPRSSPHHFDPLRLGLHGRFQRHSGAYPLLRLPVAVRSSWRWRSLRTSLAPTVPGSPDGRWHKAPEDHRHCDGGPRDHLRSADDCVVWGIPPDRDHYRETDVGERRRPFQHRFSSLWT